jgi:hypothetical protein
MDPLLLEVLRFGTAILAGGLVAVIAQRIAFRHAQNLADAERAHHRASLLAALAHEVEENIVRAGPMDRTRAPIRISHTAWDAARGLDLDEDLSAALQDAYSIGEDLNSRIAIVDAFSAAPIVAASGSDAAQQRLGHDKTIVDASHATADQARMAFEVAGAKLADYRARGG